jgi:hypothetical protein
MDARVVGGLGIRGHLIGHARRATEATELKKLRSRLTAVAAAAACVALLAGCGASAQNREARALEAAGILSNTAPLGERLITQSQINAASDKNGARTFLELWSLLQYGAVDRAVVLFEPELRHVIGTSLLADALDSGQLIWQGTKPHIVSSSGSATTVTIMFQARDESNRLLPGSITLRGGEGHWRVAYFSPLNFELQRAVQLRVQANIEPLATKPSAEAVRQGDAASAIQTNYLEHLLHAEASAKP